MTAIDVGPSYTAGTDSRVQSTRKARGVDVRDLRTGCTVRPVISEYVLVIYY